MKTENKKKIAIIGVKNTTGDEGGAERHYEGLKNCLKSENVEVDLVLEVSDERDINSIKESYLRFYDLDLSSYDGVISLKAPSYVVRHSNHICWLIHTMRVFYDMFDREFPNPDRTLLENRKFIQKLDTYALKSQNIKKIFTNGNEVAERLIKYNGIESTVLHPGLLFDHFIEGDFEDYLFIPGRVHRWKRLDLLVKAMDFVSKKSIKLFIAGTGEDEVALKKLGSKNNNIIFMGKIPEMELIKMYANALAVPFVPYLEDYGYVTLEAYRSGKPVITCSDSGEPAWFVRQSGGGIVCSPEPASIANAIDQLAEDKRKAFLLGSKGRNFVKDIQWPPIAEILLNILFK